MATEIGSLFWATGLDTSGIKKDSKGAGKSLMGAFNPATIGVAAIGGAIAKLGKDAYQFSADFNKAMLEVQTISNATQNDFEGISESIMNISMTAINDDAVGLSEAFYQIVSAGHDGAAGIEVLNAAAKAATGGVTDTATAADGLTTVLNAWGMSADEVNKVSDQMFTTVKLGKTTFGELGKHIAKVAPLAAATGIEFEQIAAATASLTKQGTPTTEAFTQMKAAIVALNKNLGDGWAETMTLQEGMKAMRDMAGGSDTQLQKLTGSSEAMLAVLSMTGDQAEGAAKDLVDMANSAGAAQAAFDTMGEDAGIIWNQVGNQFKAAMKDMGDGLLEASKGLGKFLSASMTTTDQLGDNYEAIGESVDSFIDRLRVLKNEGLTFGDALTGALSKSNEDVQNIVDGEKASTDFVAKKVAEIQDEYNKLKESGASAIELDAFKKSLNEKYAALQENSAKEAEEMAKQAKKMKILALVGQDQGRASITGVAAKEMKDIADGYKDLLMSLDDITFAEQKEAEVKLKPVIEKETIADLEAQLKELQGKKGSFGSAGGEAENLESIKLKTEEIEAAWAKVRDIRNEALGVSAIPLTPMQSIEVKKVKEVAKPKVDELVVMKQLTKEEQKQDDINRKKSARELKNNALKEKAQAYLKDTSAILGETSYLFTEIGSSIGEINPELGETLTSMGEMAGKAANFAGALASGDWIGAVTQGVGIITSIIAKFKTADKILLNSKEQASLLKDLYAEINSIMQSILNNSIALGLSDEYRLQVLQESIAAYNDLAQTTQVIDENANPEKYAEYQRTLAEIAAIKRELSDPYLPESERRRLQEELYELQELSQNLRLELMVDISQVDYIFKRIAELRELMSKPISQEQWNKYKAEMDELMSELDEINAAYAAMIDAMEQMAGFSASTVTDGIVDGILDGLKLAEDGLGDFADTFGNMMKDSGRNYLKKLFESTYLLGLMKQFAEMASDGLSQDEIDELKEQYRLAIEAFAPLAEAWKELEDQLFDQEAPELEGLSGQIKGIQQETATLLAGTFESVRANMINLVGLTTEYIEISEQIASNTSNLIPMLEEIKDMNSKIVEGPNTYT